MSANNAPTTTWSAPTRRSFLAMIGVAVAGVAIASRGGQVASLQSSLPARPRWIGHC